MLLQVAAVCVLAIQLEEDEKDEEKEENQREADDENCPEVLAFGWTGGWNHRGRANLSNCLTPVNENTSQ